MLLFFWEVRVGLTPYPPFSLPHKWEVGGQFGNKAHQQAACLGYLAGWAEQGMRSTRCGVSMLTLQSVLSSVVRYFIWKAVGLGGEGRER